MTTGISRIALLAALASGSALAQQAAETALNQPRAMAAAESNATAFTDGEIRKINKETRKVTIRHGSITNLGMPPMTMVFQVSDPALLEAVQVGDKVRFSAEKREGAFIVTALQKAA